MRTGEADAQYAVIARIPEGGADAFDAYERLVLPLLAHHGGRLERRVRTPARDCEIHLLRFDSPDGLERYLADPRRTDLAVTLERSGATVELLRVSDVI